MATDYKSTLTLPQTDFPMRASLAQREPERLAHWEKLDLYSRIMVKNANGQRFILHDGPPFTNGNAHLGHMSNRNLKDIVVRYKSMRGYSTPFHPGWDCHGLPTELKAMAELKGAEKALSPLEIRKLCRDFSEKFIGVMTTQMKRLGGHVKWEKAYRTMDAAFEANEMRVFASFVEQGFVYRDKKPVIWSIPAASAIAEAEIIYKDHVSPSITVPFFRADDATTAFVIWTTTPWTIPANVGVALNPRLEYVEILREGKKYIVAQALAEKFMGLVGWENTSFGKVAVGESFNGVMLKHPFMAHGSRVVLADYVSAEDGTGCVHTAPGHGAEDYITGKQNGLEVYSPITHQGTFADDGRMPADLVGLSLLEKKEVGSAANNAVIEKLKGLGALLSLKPYSHSYAFCDRTKTPIIYRSLEQWFVSLDRNDMRKKVMAVTEQVEWIPPQGKNRIQGSIESRPDWCISRQRNWGLPIPAFRDESGKRYIDAAVIRGLADKVQKDGTNIFYTQTAAELLSGITVPADWKVAELKPETDTLDVWFDSGSSSFAVLKDSAELSWPADLYLEGSDQHRGWFQSSLWASMVATGKAPYKKVLTHGFILDVNKQKLSKSSGALPFDEMIKKYGADVMRLWNASQDYQGDIVLSDEILDNVTSTYCTWRNTLRFQLSNLKGFDYATQAVPVGQLLALDRWMLAQTVELVKAVTAAYDAYEFAKVYQLVSRFCQVTLSAVYHDCLKDRLYTAGVTSVERRSALTVIHITHNCLVRMLAPILVFTTDEAWAHRHTGTDFMADEAVHLQNWPNMESDFKAVITSADFAALEAVKTEVDDLLTWRAKANEKLEVLRQSKTIGKSLEAKLIFKGDLNTPALKTIAKYLEAAPELFIVSQVTLENSAGEATVEAHKADGCKCPRCWRYVPVLSGELCPRCAGILTTITNG